MKKLSISLETLFKSTDTDKISSISEEVEKTLADAKLVLDKENVNAGEVSEEVIKLTEVTKKIKDTIAETAKKAKEVEEFKKAEEEKKAKEAEESKKVKQAEEANQTGTDRSAALEAPNGETVTPSRSAIGRRGPTVVQAENSTTPKVEKITSNKETSPKELPTYTKGVDNYKLADENTLEELARINGSPGYYNHRLESPTRETAKSDDVF